MRKGKLITVFKDLTIENELRLRNHFAKIIIPEITVTERVKSIRFEFITDGLLFGKVLGKKCYKVEVPREAENSVLGSRIIIDRVLIKEIVPLHERVLMGINCLLNGFENCEYSEESVREIRIEWPAFYFMNPDKIKVKIKELRRKQRKGWKGKSFKQIFWDWDGAVTLRAIIEFMDGAVGYIDILRVIFVYTGNASAMLAWANERRREYRRRIRNTLEYISAVYGDNIADIVRKYMHLVLYKPRSMSEKELRNKMNELLFNLKEELGNRRAFNFVMKLIDSIVRMRRELDYVSALMNRTSGSRFLVIVEYKKLYNPVISENGIRNEAVRFYSEIKAGHINSEERWVDSFGNQYFIVTSNWVKEIDRLGFAVTKKIATYGVEKKFRFLGRKGPLNHEIKVTRIPPKNIVLEKVKQADIKWLWEHIKPPRAKTELSVYFAEKGNIEYIVYIVKPVDRAGRYIITNYDHRCEGKDRVLVHINVGKQLLFIHKL